MAEEIKNGTETSQNGGQTVIVNQVVSNSNTMGTAGFVLALLGLIFCWVPILDWILWILGVVFSIVGVCKPNNKGLAIAGLAISFIGLIFLIVIIGVFAAAVAS